MRLEPGTIVDRYAIESVLGEGGMAIVYLARHTRLDSLHALKVLKMPVESIQERLLQEGRMQAQLNHPNVVSVTDVIDVAGSPGLVMEFIPGSSLDQLLLERRLSIEQADELALGILEGVAVAHEQGLIHRDLKPANIMLGTTGGRIIPKITDFGLAKLLDGDGTRAFATRSGLSMGTPSYMAPEQIESAKGVDARADVFSLGSILFELVAGRRPFQADSTLHLLNAVAEGDRPHVREVVPDLPDRMVHAIEGALQVPLEQRVESCRKLLEIWSDGTVLPEVANPVWDEELVSTLSHQDDWVPPETSEAPATYGLPSSRFTHPSITSPPAPPPKPRPYLAGALFVLGLAILATTLVYALRPQPSIESPAVTVGLISVEQAPAAEPKPEPVVAPTPSIAPKVDPVPEVERADDPSQPFHTFTSTPSGAVVYLDGLLVGTTPLQDFRVPRGRHRIRLVADQAEAERKLSVTRRSERHLHWDRETDVWTTPED